MVDAHDDGPAPRFVPSEGVRLLTPGDMSAPAFQEACERFDCGVEVFNDLAGICHRYGFADWLESHARHYSYLVFAQGYDLAGYVQLAMPGSDGVGRVERAAVDVQYQQQGVYTRLRRDGERLLKHAGAQTVEWLTRNPTLTSMWDRRGVFAVETAGQSLVYRLPIEQAIAL